METRTRSKRGAPPPPPPSSRPETRSRATRSTRQTTVPASVESEGSQHETGRPQPSPVKPKAGSLASNQIPRRGARPNGRGQSVASIATVPLRGEDETEYEDDDRFYGDEQEDEHGIENQGGRELAQGEGGDVEFDIEDNEGDEARYQIMKLSLPDLAKASDDLMVLLKEPQYDNPVFSGLHRLKSRALESFREIYEEPHTSPFIDWIQLINMYENADDAAPAAEIMARANIATVFDEICDVEVEKRMDATPVLSKLNSFFPSFFITSGDSNQDPELTLDIRTLYLIFMLAREEREIDPFSIIADLFCEPAEGVSYAHRFSHGPYKKLWDGDQAEDVDEICSERIKDIVSAIHKERGTLGVRQLIELFPLEDLLEKLKAWFSRMYATLKGSRTSIPVGQQLESGIPRDDEDETEDSQADFAESQPIVRAGTGEAEPSLFVGAASLMQLHGQSKEGTAIPPSNQNQAAPPPGAPRDYPSHTNDELLSTPQPEKSGFSRPAARAKAKRAPRGKAANVETIPEGGDEDEDEDAFETDTRPVDKGKRKAIESALPAPKRNRVAAPSATPSATPATESAPAPEHPPPSDPSQADLQRVKAEKEIIAQRARLAQTHGFKQRYAWSDNDTATLIALIRERHAAWAAIQNLDNNRFEHPRNQQAYRDKARNLKVDYLMTDANLPPGFDLVALGKKEIERLKALGKNPWRKEEDIDADGKPVGVDHEDGFDDED